MMKSKKQDKLSRRSKTAVIRPRMKSGFRPKGVPLVLGVTGGFGTGKTTVSGMFRVYGAKVLDADKIARRVQTSNSGVIKKMVREFGKDIIKKNGVIDRVKLARIVFNDPSSRNKLNAIVHPEVIKIFKKEIKQASKKFIPTFKNRGYKTTDEVGISPQRGRTSGTPGFSPRGFIVLDVPLLFEAKLEHMADKIIVVKAGSAQQYKRLAARTALSKKDILKRINAQMPLSNKVRKADFVIDNSGTIEKTKEQVLQLRRMLWKN